MGEGIGIVSFEELLSYLRYFATADRLQALRDTPPEERAGAWAAFWKSTDPNPATVENEALTDYFEPMDGDDANERAVIVSGDEARAALSRLAGLVPRIAVLEGPDGQVFQIGIGGPWAGFARIETERGHGLEQQRVRIALPQIVSAPAQVEFLRWAQPCTLAREELFPAAEVVELVAAFVGTGAFPEWVGWRSG